MEKSTSAPAALQDQAPQPARLDLLGPLGRAIPEVLQDQTVLGQPQR